MLVAVLATTGIYCIASTTIMQRANGHCINSMKFRILKVPGRCNHSPRMSGAALWRLILERAPALQCHAGLARANRKRTTTASPKRLTSRTPIVECRLAARCPLSRPVL